MKQIARLSTSALIATTVVLSAENALALEADLGVEASARTTGAEPSQDSAFLLGGKVGGIMPLNGLSPFVSGGVELGYIFGGTRQRIAALVSATYTAPPADGAQDDTRLMYDNASGEYSWSIVQKELVIQPTFMYRLTLSGSLVPFVGIGPRIYFLETLAEGEANGESILESSEQSLKLGAGLPLGVEYTVGPGGIMAELLAEWAPLDHRITGDTSLMAATLFLGYRARL